MNTEFYISSYGEVKLLRGWPLQSKHFLLPQSDTYYIIKDFGSILLQEIATEQYTFRYYIFYFLEKLELHIQEKGEGLQTLLALKGNFHHGIKGKAAQSLMEGQFTILDAGTGQTETTIPAGRECHLINAYYHARAYEDLLPLFPVLRKDLIKSLKRPFFFLQDPRPSRHAALSAIHEVLFEAYAPQLQKKHGELKLKGALFTQLAQAYTEKSRRSTPLEKEMVQKAVALIQADLAKHYLNEELAVMLNWNESSLKRAFKREMGVGMYEYLRRLRMNKAHELLLGGELVKNIAPAIGMRPTNFTMEFQRHFGYKTTTLRKNSR